MKNTKLINYKELERINNRLGDTLDILHTIEPYIAFKYRKKYKKAYEFIEFLYFKTDKLIINITDKTERDYE